MKFICRGPKCATLRKRSKFCLSQCSFAVARGDCMPRSPVLYFLHADVRRSIVCIQLRVAIVKMLGAGKGSGQHRRAEPHLFCQEGGWRALQQGDGKIVQSRRA